MKRIIFNPKNASDCVAENTDENDRSLRIYAGLSDKAFEMKKSLVAKKKVWLSKIKEIPEDLDCYWMREDIDEQYYVDANGYSCCHINGCPAKNQIFKLFDDDGNAIGYEMICISVDDFEKCSWGHCDVPVHKFFVPVDEVEGWNANEIVSLLHNKLLNAVCDGIGNEEKIVPLSNGKTAGICKFASEHYNARCDRETGDAMFSRELIQE